MTSSGNRRLRRSLVGIVVCVLLSVCAANSARAQIPVTDVGAILQALQSYLQLLQQYETQLRQYQTQIQQYQNMVQNSAQLLNGGNWTNVSSALAGISGDHRRHTEPGNRLGRESGAAQQRQFLVLRQPAK